VKGNFPIGFLIWSLGTNEVIDRVETSIIGNDQEMTQASEIGKKIFHSTQKGGLIIDWLRKHFDQVAVRIGYLRIQGTDVQQNNTIFVTSQPSESDFRESKVTSITKNNIFEASIYFSVRNIVKPNWLNDRDQYLYPVAEVQTDIEFRNDCLVYALFNNNIQSKHGTNHWIPFSEVEVNAQDKFESNFMFRFINGKIPRDQDLLGLVDEPLRPLVFSEDASMVLSAGKELWKFYHAQPGCITNASLYDIKEYFQGRNEKGRMNSNSQDEDFVLLISKLRDGLQRLGKKIVPKIFELGFLK
jgi:hypothetical protein